MSRQTDRHRCECGRQAQVTPTDSPWEFDYACLCGRTGVISFAHASPPPAWDGQTRMVQDVLPLEVA